MGLSSPEKSAKRQKTLDQEVADHPLRNEAVPMIQQAFALWDDVRRTSDSWPLKDIERFAIRCAEIKLPMDKFRQEKHIPHNEDTYQNAVVFTNRWHVNLCTEAMDRLMNDLRKELEMIGMRSEVIATEIRRYLGANIDGYIKQGKEYQNFKKSVWDIVEGFKEIERINDLIEKACKQRIDTESTYKGSIARAMEALNELRDDFFKHGDHHHSKRSATFLLWTLIVSLGAFILSAANISLQIWQTSQPQPVQIELEESISRLLQRGGTIRLPRSE